MEVKPLRPSALLIAGGVVLLNLALIAAAWAGVEAVTPDVITMGVVGSIIALAGVVGKLSEDAPPGESDEVVIRRMELEHEARMKPGSDSEMVAVLKLFKDK